MSRILIVELPVNSKEAILEEDKTSQLVSIVNSALVISHNIRRDTILHLILRDGILTVDGRNLRNYRPDYLSARGLLVKGLKKEVKRGIVFREGRRVKNVRLNLEDSLRISIVDEGYGVDIEDYNFKTKHKNFIVAFLKNQRLEGFTRAKIKPENYSLEQKILIVQNWLDRVTSSWRVEC